MKIFVIGLIFVFAVSAFGLMNSRAGYGTAEYKVVSNDGAFEIRDYKAAMLVTAPMSGGGTRNGSAFGKLFRYISGANESKEKISMTSPVLSTIGEKGKMSFVVPKDVALRGAPLPTSKDVVIEEMPAGRFATVRFSGSPSAGRYAEAQRLLKEWIEKKDLRTSGEFLSAGYDPPYTPQSLRRNEVMVRLAE